MRTLLCPSSAATAEDAQLFGIVERDSNGLPSVQYLEHSQAISTEFLRQVNLTEDESGRLLRVASPCAKNKCQHHNETSGCQLVERVVQFMPLNSEHLPICAIRKDCVWWHQTGPKSCQRCEHIVTQSTRT